MYSYREIILQPTKQVKLEKAYREERTPQRREYLENIYSDFKLEFDAGVMEYGDN